MKLRESLAVGSIVAGALGMANEGCAFSQYPQGIPGQTQPNRETVVEQKEMEEKLSEINEAGDQGKVMADLEDPFDIVCDDMKDSVNFVMDGKYVSLLDCDKGDVEQ